MTIEDQLTFELPEWDCVSKECKTLIENMLNKNHYKRINIEQVLSDTWFNL